MALNGDRAIDSPEQRMARLKDASPAQLMGFASVKATASRFLGRLRSGISTSPTQPLTERTAAASTASRVLRHLKAGPNAPNAPDPDPDFDPGAPQRLNPGAAASSAPSPDAAATRTSLDTQDMPHNSSAVIEPPKFPRGPCSQMSSEEKWPLLGGGGTASVYNDSTHNDSSTSAPAFAPGPQTVDPDAVSGGHRGVSSAGAPVDGDAATRQASSHGTRAPAPVDALGNGTEAAGDAAVSSGAAAAARRTASEGAQSVAPGAALTSASIDVASPARPPSEEPQAHGVPMAAPEPPQPGQQTSAQKQRQQQLRRSAHQAGPQPEAKRTRSQAAANPSSEVEPSDVAASAAAMPPPSHAQLKAQALASEAPVVHGKRAQKRKRIFEPDVEPCYMRRPRNVSNAETPATSEDQQPQQSQDGCTQSGAADDAPDARGRANADASDDGAAAPKARVPPDMQLTQIEPVTVNADLQDLAEELFDTGGADLDTPSRTIEVHPDHATCRVVLKKVRTQCGMKQEHKCAELVAVDGSSGRPPAIVHGGNFRVPAQAALLLKGRVTFTNTRFEGLGTHTASLLAAGSDTVVVFKRCTFVGCCTAAVGGASVTLTSCTCTESQRACVFAMGGSSLVMSNTTVLRSRVGLEIMGPSTSATVNNCVLHDCSSVAAYIAFGSTLEMRSSRLTGCKKGGGLIVIGGSASAHKCVLSQNFGPGAQASMSAKLELTKCELTHSTSEVGLLVSHSRASAEASDCSFSHNAQAGVQVQFTGQVKLEGCELTDSQEGSGLVVIHAGSSADVTESVLSRNALDGARVESGAAMTLDECTVAASLGSSGVIVKGKDSTARMDGCVVEDNSERGVHVLERGRLELKHSWLLRSQNGEGLAVEDEGSFVAAQACTIGDNLGCGAGVYTAARVEMTGCAITGSYLSGLLVEDVRSVAALRRCIFADNHGRNALARLGGVIERP